MAVERWPFFLMTYLDKLLARFFKARKRLIINLLEGRIDKGQFLSENYLLIQNQSMRPFVDLKNLDICLYNYQYYNVLAKHSIQQANGARTFRDRDQFRNRAENYYIEKDKATQAFVGLADQADLEAYPLIMDSTRLDQVLFEINYMNRDYVVLHSMSDQIRASLTAKGVFKEEPRLSLINHYINEEY